MPVRWFRVVTTAVLLCVSRPAVAGNDPFAYDTTAPLAARFGAAVRSGAANSRDVHFAGGPQGEVAGTIVAPVNPSRAHGAIVWVHWLGEPATTNRSEFAADAQALAERGATSLLIDALWSHPKWYDARTPANDERDFINQVIAIRRALDVLVAQPGVDPRRVALVGHDFGAMTGALAAAVDPRVRYGVFMTPSPTFWEWMLYATPPVDTAAYAAQMSAYDLPRWVPRAPFAASLWQFGKNDPYVAAYTRVQAKTWIPDRDRTITAYDAGHDLQIPTATEDRRAWLVAHLVPS